MDAVEFLKENERMCIKTDICADCPAYEENNGHDVTCNEFMDKYPEEYVPCVEKWSAEHPVKTRQSEFLKMFPNVAINLDGVIDIDPCLVDKKTDIVIAKNMIVVMNAIKNTGLGRLTNAEI